MAEQRPQKDYQAMARAMGELKKHRDRVKRRIRELAEARAARDVAIREAINTGVTWRDAAKAAGLSSVQVGKVMRRASDEQPDLAETSA